MTFAATANCVVYQGGNPGLRRRRSRCRCCRSGRGRGADHPADPGHDRPSITPASPATIGRCGAIARRHGLALVADACALARGRGPRASAVGKPGRPEHLQPAPGQTDHRRRGRTRWPPTTPNLPGGCGGSATTASSDRSPPTGVGRLLALRDAELGYNYRLTDIQACPGPERNWPGWTAGSPGGRRSPSVTIGPSPRCPAFARWAVRPGVCHGRHLYVVRLGTPHAPREGLRHAERDEYKAGVAAGANTHRGRGLRRAPREVRSAWACIIFRSICTRFYRERFATGPGSVPVAEAAYGEILSLPLFPAMTDDDVDGSSRPFERWCRSMSRMRIIGDHPGPHGKLPGCRAKCWHDVGGRTMLARVVQRVAGPGWWTTWWWPPRRSRPTTPSKRSVQIGGGQFPRRRKRRVGPFPPGGGGPSGRGGRADHGRLPAGGSRGDRPRGPGFSRQAARLRLQHPLPDIPSGAGRGGADRPGPGHRLARRPGGLPAGPRDALRLSAPRTVPPAFGNRGRGP